MKYLKKEYIAIVAAFHGIYTIYDSPYSSLSTCLPSNIIFTRKHPNIFPQLL